MFFSQSDAKLMEGFADAVSCFCFHPTAAGTRDSATVGSATSESNKSPCSLDRRLLAGSGADQPATHARSPSLHDSRLDLHVK